MAIVHYASPPIVGGVESVIAHHARGLAAYGHDVRVISGAGGDFDPRAETVILPLLDSRHPDILSAKRSLDAGYIPQNFDALTRQISDQLRPYLTDCDVMIAHNIHTLHKNLPLTAALHALADENGPRQIAWAHDLAWTNEQYLPELHSGQPWDLLRTAWPRTRYVTVSESRRGETAALLNIAPGDVEVITGGVDPAAFGGWGDATRGLAERLNLLDAGRILLTPARLTRRKNVELALRVLAALRVRSGEDDRLIVTGPPGPHNPGNLGYLGELLDLRRELGLESSAHFLYELGSGGPFIPDDATVAQVFFLADALLFPSTQEGFGLPMLEAGMARLPIFCSDLPPLRETAGELAHYFDPETTSPEIIAGQIFTLLNTSPAYRLRERVRRQFRWEAIIRDRLLPLISEKST